ncbi:hypothetical protein DPMN_004247 [Dreissena polymorpha]|uniref:Uncharacterized protein n=1 Tax=Dreissena polymorpha TaxID=45954 RepID=A0A9D4RTE2_DREPO|nr:hypothetical protein DPMN_004247 [Dreissena polymorpha]
MTMVNIGHGANTIQSIYTHLKHKGSFQRRITRLLTPAVWIGRSQNSPKTPPTGISFHPIGCTSQHQKARPNNICVPNAGSKLCMRVSRRLVTGTALPLFFSFRDNTPKGGSSAATDVPSQPRKYQNPLPPELVPLS